jgi:hypothetical protein
MVRVELVHVVDHQPQLLPQRRQVGEQPLHQRRGDGGTGAVARLTGASWQAVADGAAGLASFR